MKGLVIVICAPSQGGKDFIATKIMDSLSLFDKKSSYATVYKVRETRENDGKHIKCVRCKEDISVAESDRLEATIYGSQTIVYDKKEIGQKLANGEIVFIATGSPELTKKVKSEFGTQCFSVFVQVQQVSEEIMIKEDLKRHGDPSALIIKEMENSKQRVTKRLKDYELMKPDYVGFVQDEDLGADHVFKNLYTLVGGSWNSEIDNMAEGEFISLTNKILNIYSMINHNLDWKNAYSLSEDERKNTKNLFTLQDVWLEYLDRKNCREL